VYLYGAPYGGSSIPPAATTSLAFAFFGIALLALAGPQAWPRGEADGAATRPAPVLFLVFALLAVGIVAAGSLYFRNYAAHYRVEVERGLSSVAALKVSEMTLYRKERLADGAIFQRNAAFAGLVRRAFDNSEDAEAQAGLRAWLGNIQARYQYSRALVLDAHGTPWMAIPELTGPLSSVVARRAAEVQRSGKIAVQDFYRNEHDQRVYLSTLVPILDEENGDRVLGVLALRIDPETYLYPFISRWPTASETAETVLVRREGNDALYLNELRFKNNTALTLRVPLEWQDATAVKAVLGQEGIVEGLDYRGVPVIADLRRVPDSPWFLVTHIAASEVYAALRERMWTTILLVCTMLIGAGAGIVSIWRQQSTRFYLEQYEAERDRAWLRDVIARSLNEIYVFNPETWRFSFANAGACRNIGYSAEELAQLTPLDLKPSFTREEFDAILRPLRTGEREVTVFETNHRRKNGSEYAVEVHLQHVHVDGGAVFLAIVNDITERKRAESALRESENLYRSLFDNMLNGFAYCQLLYEEGRPKDYVYLEVNRAFETLTGLKDVIGKTVTAVIPNATATDLQVLEIYDRVAQTGVPEHFEVYIEGLGMWFSISVYSPKKEYVVTVFDVITERKRAESALRESEDRYRDLVEHSQDLISTHDLKGNLLSANEATVRVTGYPRDALLHMNLRDLLDPEVGAQLSTYLTEMRTRGEAHGTMRIRTAGGELRFWEFNNTLRRDGTAGPIVRGMAQDVTERRQAQERLRLQGAALDAAANAMVITNREGNIQWVNPAFTRLAGYTLDEAIGKNPRDLVRSGRQDRAFYKHLWDTILGGQVWRGEIVNRRKDGSLYTEALTITPLRHERGEVSHFIAIKEDITERLQLEVQLRQAQKMEAVGQLAGGVAHDFNNQIFVINGYCDLLLGQADLQPALMEPLAEIKKAAQRSAALTGQLLAFSRKLMLQPKVLDLNAELLAIETMLQRLIGEDVQLTFLLDKSAGTVKVDPNQLQQVVLNLAVNARDAMPHGGRLTVETANVELDEAYTETHIDVRPGSYVILSVSDSGHGMDRETLSHMLEPFFTTKEPGKGTGLGLAMVHGVVKQSGGHITVYSDPDHGTTFKVYLPRVDEAIETAERGVTKEVAGGSETILLVEDETAVRGLVQRILAARGYRVLATADGKEALQLAERHAGPIHLLLTDVVMPVMSGAQLAERLNAAHPEIRVIYMSGYTENAIVRHGVLHPGLAFLPKPCPTELLLRRVREILDDQPRKDLRGRRILVVDDSQDERTLQARMLSKSGCVVLEASGSTEALRLLEREAVDAVVTDLNMPGMDGFALTEAIRRSPQLRTLPVIILSGSCTEEEHARCRAVGASACLNKGATDQQDLLDILAKVL
ncbi:MAG: PAS domain S-box protein, partial [Deltaproteobacteria bacterium]|nr:PAS domain S-box protein [Deltaproteobacteria bacterium]